MVQQAHGAGTDHSALPPGPVRASIKKRKTSGNGEGVGEGRKRKEASVPWTHAEQDLLCALVKERLDPQTGSDALVQWGEIAACMGSRNAKQCREKYRNDLRTNISKCAWTREEEYVLVLAHSILGNKWNDIAKYLPRRAENTIKNHWYATIRAKAEVRTKSFLWLYAVGAPPGGDQAHLRTVQGKWTEMATVSDPTLPPLSSFEVRLDHFTAGPGVQQLAQLQQAEMVAAANAMNASRDLMSATARAAALGAASALSDGTYVPQVKGRRSIKSRTSNKRSSSDSDLLQASGMATRTALPPNYSSRASAAWQPQVTIAPAQIQHTVHAASDMLAAAHSIQAANPDLTTRFSSGHSRASTQVIMLEDGDATCNVLSLGTSAAGQVPMHPKVDEYVSTTSSAAPAKMQTALVSSPLSMWGPNMLPLRHFATTSCKPGQHAMGPTVMSGYTARSASCVPAEYHISSMAAAVSAQAWPSLHHTLMEPAQLPRPSIASPSSQHSSPGTTGYCATGLPGQEPRASLQCSAPPSPDRAEDLIRALLAEDDIWEEGDPGNLAGPTAPGYGGCMAGDGEVGESTSWEATPWANYVSGGESPAAAHAISPCWGTAFAARAAPASPCWTGGASDTMPMAWRGTTYAPGQPTLGEQMWPRALAMPLPMGPCGPTAVWHSTMSSAHEPCVRIDMPNLQFGL